MEGIDYTLADFINMSTNYTFLNIYMYTVSYRNLTKLFVGDNYIHTKVFSKMSQNLKICVGHKFYVKLF